MRWFETKWPAVLLFPLAALYAFLVQLRNFFYDQGWLKSQRVICAVISVGNITVGGTGKTPAVQFLANDLKARGKTVAVISRGYGRESRGSVVVADGCSILASVTEAGDEPLMLAHNCPGAVVIVDSNRVRAAKLAILQFKVNVIVLDDGFQHRKIARDLNIVALRRTQSFGNGFCLPAGPLREPLFNIRRADLLLVTGDENLPMPELEKFHRPVLSAGYELTDFMSVNGNVIEASALFNKRAVVFCGLANPQNFSSTLEKTGVKICEFLTFKDHYFYTSRDILEIKSKVDQLKADVVLTTEKDWVKLSESWLDERWLKVRMTLNLKNRAAIVSLIEKIF
jgi:tetraacyldisaccharide 4'-kinase